MPKLGNYKPREIISALNKAGFEEVRTKGSHIQMKKGNYLVTVPYHNRDLNPTILKSILRQSHLTIDELKLYL
ncbi:MAG: type II toxin-antitoxin system HicA family toxin [Ignavibacteriae bacterium]|nr:type II toxin-antitoxin system HicA family toxin [Ignavibacteriota bacterium]